MMLGLLGSVYVAFSPVLIGGLLLPQFGRALAVVGLMHLFRLSDFAVRMPDQFFLGAGRTGTSSWLVGIAHVGRILLTDIFVARFGFYGLFSGFTLSATLKAVGRVAVDGTNCSPFGFQLVADLCKSHARWCR